ncbi:TonB-dependent receptor [Tenacibaculum pacificus]|uniref:TonB-dependent receptor n=1 Tax=Tenacibaculum pacificus TaxID=3018314 RepID=UPI0022F4014A|nr:TonB-dependent receptor [Tenacibaculum pacificus]WBX74708.1 TonB-dependent receptor [Tenacibaculum pacificus]
MNFKSIVLMFLLWSYCSITIAQNCAYTLSGLVDDFHDKSPIVGATVFVKNQNKYTTTDVNGKFTINNLCKGVITIEISHLACDSKTLTLNINENIYKIIDLEHHIEELNEVNLKAKTGLKTKIAQETLINANTLEKFSSKSLGDAIKNIAGVSSINTGSTIIKPVINGLHSSRVLISFNNVRLQDQEWGIEHAPNIDVNAAETVSVIKGANALEYGGDAIGGVVIVNPSKVIINKDTLYGKTILSQQSNGRLLNFTTRLQKNFAKGLYINGQASYKRSGDFKAPDYYLTNTGIAAKAFTIGTGYKNFDKGFELFYSHLINKIGILSASHVGSASDLKDAINSDTPLKISDFSYTINNPKQQVTHQLFKASFYKRFKGLGKLSLQYDFQRNNRLEFDIRRGDNKNLAATDLLLKTHAFKANLNIDSKSFSSYKFGIAGSSQNNFPDPATKVKRIIPDYNKYTFSSYGIGDFKLENILLSAGVRYDFERINAKKYYQNSRWESLGYQNSFSHFIIEKDLQGSQLLVNPVFTYHNISTSLGVSYNINEKSSLLANYGLANRAPNASELFSDGLHHSASRIELGDLRLQTETSSRFSATYKFNHKKLNFSTEGFYNLIDNFIYIEPSGTELTQRGTFVIWDYKQINAVLFGVDTNINYQLNENIGISNKSSFIKGKDTSSKRNLVDIPPFKTVTQFTFNKMSWLNFHASVESEYNAKQNNFPNNNFEVFIPQTNTHELVDISTPPNAYHLLNFSSGVKFNLSETNIGLTFSVDNMLNTSYRNYLNKQRYFTDDLGRNFNIQIKINY